MNGGACEPKKSAPVTGASVHSARRVHAASDDRRADAAGRDTRDAAGDAGAYRGRIRCGRGANFLHCGRDALARGLQRRGRQAADPLDAGAAGRRHQGGSAADRRSAGQFALGNVGLALEAFRMALRDDPNSIDAMMGVAACYDRMTRFDLSRRQYEAALAIAPGDPTLLTAFAASLDAQGRAVEAASVRQEVKQRLALAAASQPPVPTPATVAPIKANPPPQPLRMPKTAVALRRLLRPPSSAARPQGPSWRSRAPAGRAGSGRARSSSTASSRPGSGRACPCCAGSGSARANRGRACRARASRAGSRRGDCGPAAARRGAKASRRIAGDRSQRDDRAAAGASVAGTPPTKPAVEHAAGVAPPVAPTPPGGREFGHHGTRRARRRKIPRRAKRRPEARADFDARGGADHGSGTPVDPADHWPHPAERDGSLCPFAPGADPPGRRPAAQCGSRRPAGRPNPQIPCREWLARDLDRRRVGGPDAQRHPLSGRTATTAQRLRRNSDSRWLSARALAR